jgi:hypothetical protein
MSQELLLIDAFYEREEGKLLLFHFFCIFTVIINAISYDRNNIKIRK